MSTSRWSTTTPDGRFELRCRIKDSWGDYTTNERHWTLHELPSGRILSSWHHEDDNDTASVTFASDFRSLIITNPDGSTTIFPLP